MLIQTLVSSKYALESMDDVEHILIDQHLLLTEYPDNLVAFPTSWLEHGVHFTMEVMPLATEVSVENHLAQPSS